MSEECPLIAGAFRRAEIVKGIARRFFNASDIAAILYGLGHVWRTGLCKMVNRLAKIII